MLLENELSDFSADMYLDLIIKFNEDVHYEDTNKFNEDEDIRTLSEDSLRNKLEKSLAISVERVEKMVKKQLVSSDLIRLCHIGIEIANARVGKRQEKKRKSGGSDESSSSKKKLQEPTVSFSTIIDNFIACFLVFDALQSSHMKFKRIFRRMSKYNVFKLKVALIR